MHLHRRLPQLAIAIALVLTTQSLTFAGTYQSNSAGPTAYTEQADPVAVAPNATLSTDTGTAQNYGGGSLTVSVESATAQEALNVVKSASADTAAGSISVVGNLVYRGNGTSAEAIGQISGSQDGTAGKSLKFDFAPGFTNGDFQDVSAVESGNTVSLTGWTIYRERAYLNDAQNKIAGFPTPAESNSVRMGASGDRSTVSGQSYTYTLNQLGESGGTDKALRLTTAGSCTEGYCVVRGPYVVSNNPVALRAGDSVSFNWKAFGGSDAYDVFGYLVNTSTGGTITLLDATGPQANIETSWASANVTVPSGRDGSYKFVFIAGTWDASGGTVQGGSLAIDDVAVSATPPTVSAPDIEQITRLVTYSHSGDNPPALRNVVFTTNPSGGLPAEILTQQVALTAIDDAPVPGNTTITALGDGQNAVDTINGTLSATDVDGPNEFTFGIQGVTPQAGIYETQTAYGTLSVVEATGAYSLEPDSAAVNALANGSTASISVTITATSGSPGVTGTGLVTITASRQPGITSISPSSGIISGGTVVTITGRNLAGITSVEFGGTAGTSFSGGASQIQVTTPAKSAGTYNVVLNASGAVTVTQVNGFQFVTLQAPGAPRNVGISRSETGLQVTYETPTVGGQVASYSIVVTKVSDSTSATVQCALTLRCSINGLTADTAYDVVVRATNAAGTTAATAVNVRTLAPVPSLPSPANPPAAPVITGTVVPGSSGAVRTVIVGGQPQEVAVPLVIVPINNSTGLRLTTEVPTNGVETTTVVAELEARTGSGQPAQLDANGNFRVQRGLDTEVSGAGFKPGTDAQVWLFSTPTLLGTFTVDGQGGFVGTVSIPVQLAAGTHTLQLSGITTANDVLSLAVGISLTSPPMPNPLLPLARPVINGQPVVGQTLTCIAPAFDRAVQIYAIYFRVGDQVTPTLSGLPAPVPSLLVTAEMVGKEVQCVVTAQTKDAVSTTANQTSVILAAESGPRTPTPVQPQVRELSVAFAAGSARLSPTARAALVRVDLTGVSRVTVKGFVRKGSTARERALLPRARAAAVVSLLRARGFTGIITTASAVGSTGTARDRRVEIQLTR